MPILPIIWPRLQARPRRHSDRARLQILAAGPLTIDRTHTGVVHNLMPARNGVFDYNLSQ